ncbi:FAD-binding oxidoreductase [Pseudonocardia sp. RS11V-5]|uniref:FAD-binding oxidoreductase n=1 Tax=Pseudonocardia terrae TaxID=2905831 RepID=UPI001E50B639|nr:FAD-binding oxidoreductase [Pseudonocardia terrae]MCE3553882.1 FAD-binding oxidoreductase [Pseudonocardia terrae]
MSLTTDIPELGSLVTGAVLAPADQGYADAAVGFNLATEHRPDYVVRAADAQDVVATVGYARATGRRVAVQATGHGAAAAGPGTVLVVTSDLDTLTVDPASRTATLGAGVRWQQVLDAAAPHGLGGLCGSSPGAGVVGYTLGGGLSPIGRTFGWAADNVRSIDVVTPDGVLRTVDAGHDPELFWALRGGGAAFGIVTAMTIDLVEVPALYGGGIFVDATTADVPRVLRIWRDWAEALPETANPSVARLNLPDLPMVPEPLRGKAVVHVRFAFVGDVAEGERLIAPLRAALPEPLLDAVGPLPVPAFAAIHADPVDPMPFVDRGVLLAKLPDAALDAFAEATSPAAGLPFVLSEIRLLGAAFARPPAVPNAVAGRSAPYFLDSVGMLVPPIAEHVSGALATIVERMLPWSTGGTTTNIAGGVDPEAVERLRAGFGPETVARLDALRAEVDPDGLLDPAARWTSPPLLPLHGV